MIEELKGSTTIFYGTGENDLSDKCKRGVYRLMNFVKHKDGKLYAYKVEKMTYDALDDDEVERQYPLFYSRLNEKQRQEIDEHL